MVLRVCNQLGDLFNEAVVGMGADDLLVDTFPSMCSETSGICEKSMNEAIFSQQAAYVFCCELCPIRAHIPEDNPPEVITYDNIFAFHLGKQLASYIAEGGGYMMTDTWLDKWQAHMGHQGFDQVTGREFYKGFCRKLVYVQLGDNNRNPELEALSDYLDLPYEILMADTEVITRELQNIRQKSAIDDLEQRLKEEYKKDAEYNAIFTIFGQMMASANLREAINKAKSMFTLVMGAKQVEISFLKYEELFGEAGYNWIIHHKVGQLVKEENRFSVWLGEHEDTVSIIDVGGFKLPQYIDKYYEFSCAIAKVISLTITNFKNMKKVNQYDALLVHKKELEYLSYHDMLTGLYNRTYFNKIIESNLADKLAILCMDINGLKKVNDQFGHIEGDELIVIAGEILKKTFRDADVIVRMGGDEFVVILENCEEEEVQKFITRINEEMTKANVVAPKDHLKISMSIGYAIDKESDKDIIDLLKKADQSMYKAKKIHHESLG